MPFDFPNGTHILIYLSSSLNKRRRCPQPSAEPQAPENKSFFADAYALLMPSARRPPLSLSRCSKNWPKDYLGLPWWILG